MLIIIKDLMLIFYLYLFNSALSACNTQAVHPSVDFRKRELHWSLIPKIMKFYQKIRFLTIHQKSQNLTFEARKPIDVHIY